MCLLLLSVDHDQVIFDLFNEPYPDNGNWNSQVRSRPGVYLSYRAFSKSIVLISRRRAGNAGNGEAPARATAQRASHSCSRPCAAPAAATSS
jgi:hypothetical protein